MSKILLLGEAVTRFGDQSQPVVVSRRRSFTMLKQRALVVCVLVAAAVASTGGGFHWGPIRWIPFF